MEKTKRRLPDWMKTPMPVGKQYLQVKGLVQKLNFIQFVPAVIALTALNAGAQALPVL